MKIYDGKTYRDMTPEEIAEYEQAMSNATASTPEPTPDERLAALEDELAATKILLGLEE